MYTIVVPIPRVMCKCGPRASIPHGPHGIAVATGPAWVLFAVTYRSKHRQASAKNTKRDLDGIQDLEGVSADICVLRCSSDETRQLPCENSQQR